MSRTRQALALATIALVAACSDSPTAPPPIIGMPALSRSADDVRITRSRDTQDVTIVWTSSCGLGTFLPGTYTLHIVTSTFTRSDGTPVIRQRFSGRGQLQDVNGNTYRLTQIGNSVQEGPNSDPNGPYTLTVTSLYRINAPRRLPDEFVWVRTELAWDGTNFVVKSAYVPRCQ